MKKIMVDVTCVRAEFSDVPEHVFIELDSALVSRIKSLSKFVKENCLNSVDFFIDGALYFSSSALEELSERVGANSITSEMISASQEDIDMVELSKIVVFENKFTLSCTPKHLGESERCKSEAISLEVLDSQDDYITASY